MVASTFEPILKKPFRLPPPTDEVAPEMRAMCNLALCVVSTLLGLEETCPRRECRHGCRAGDTRTCCAEFPPVAWEMVVAIGWFAHAVDLNLMLNLQAAAEARDEAKEGEDGEDDAA